MVEDLVDGGKATVYCGEAVGARGVFVEIATALAIAYAGDGRITVSRYSELVTDGLIRRQAVVDIADVRVSLVPNGMRTFDSLGRREKKIKNSLLTVAATRSRIMATDAETDRHAQP